MPQENNRLNPYNDVITVNIPTDKGSVTVKDFGPESKIDHGFWINDLFFEVPPERISSQEENNFLEFQGIRASESYKVPVGISSEYFTIAINIPSRSAIVNIDSRPEGSGENNTGKRGGVLDLVLQFKYIPFACIENAYLRSKLKIPLSHNMVFCLHNLTLSTAPGEPGNIVANLTISLMSYTPYSDKWLYKKDWVSKEGFSFEDINEINLEGRIPYGKKVPENPETTNAQARSADIAGLSENSIIFVKNLFGQAKNYESHIAANSNVNIVNPQYSEIDSINNIDIKHMAPFEITRYARESTPYKAYIDWLYSKHKEVPIKYLENYDCTKILPYNGKESNENGNYVTIKYKEFRNIPIDTWTADKLRILFKKRVTRLRANLYRELYSGLDSLEYEIQNSDVGYEEDLKSLNDQTFEAKKIFKEALNKKAFENYKAHIESAAEAGWIHYEDDPTALDIFYREHVISISCNSTLGDGKAYNNNLLAYKMTEAGEHGLVCDFISCGAQNLYKKIPIQGAIYPTAQYIGQPSNQYLVSIKGIGLNSVKILDLVKDTIKKQALTFKYIPDSYVVKVENEFLNMLGDVYFVINGLESSTVPEQPGLYSLELRLTGNNIYIKDTKIKRESIIADKKIKETFFKELLEPNRENEKKITIGFEGEVSGGRSRRGEKLWSKTGGFYVYSPDGYNSPLLEEMAATFNLINFLIIRNTDEINLGKHQVQVNEGEKPENALVKKMAPLKDLLDEFATETNGFKIFYERFGQDILNHTFRGGYNKSIPLSFFIRPYRYDINLIERNTPDYIGWSNISYGSSRTEAANASLWPIYIASNAHKEEYPLNIFDDNFLERNKLKYKLFGSSGVNIFTGFTGKSMQAPNYWDYVLEKNSAIEKDAQGNSYYNGSPGGKYNFNLPVARPEAWAKTDIFDILPYAKAKELWQSTKANWTKPNKNGRHYVGVMFPYLANHRKVMAIAENTLTNYILLLAIPRIKQDLKNNKFSSQVQNVDPNFMGQL